MFAVLEASRRQNHKHIVGWPNQIPISQLKFTSSSEEHALAEFFLCFTVVSAL